MTDQDLSVPTAGVTPARFSRPPVAPLRPVTPVKPVKPIKPPVIRMPEPTVTALSAPALGGAVGCDFRSGLNQLVFVEFAGRLSRFDLFPTATVLSSGTTVLHGGATLDLDTGAEGGTNDVSWEETPVVRELAPANGATIVNLGAVDFAALSSAGLQGLPYGSTAIPGTDDATNRLVAGDVFAVHTSNGNFAKLRVISYGSDLTLEWVTYQLDPAYAVLGTGYDQPEDVRTSSDGAHAYVTERSGNLLQIDLAAADRSHARLIASGMQSPQQLFLDENAGVAYTVEYAAAGTLWRIDLATGTKSAVLTGLDHAVGVVVSADGRFAYISEQTVGADGGRVSEFRLSTGVRTALATGLTAPFFLTWADAAQTSLFCLQRDPSNSLVTVNRSGGSSVVATSLDIRPSCAAVVTPGRLLITCDQVIDEVRLSPPGQQPTGPLLESIGFVPFDWIDAGLADTTSHDPSYFFQVQGAPFGGSLPVMVNFARAALDGAAFYRVSVDGNVRVDQFHTAKWDGTAYQPVVVGTQSVSGAPGFYAVPSIADLLLFVQPLPGCYLDSTNLTDGSLHQIDVEFFDAAGNHIESATPLHILVDNRPCSVTLAPAAIGTTTATTNCGYLQYHPGAILPEVLTIPYTASQPGNFATWSFSLRKAANVVASDGGAVPGPTAPFAELVSTALDGCTVAAFAVQVSAAASATTGWGRCSQYDRSATEAFALAP